MSTFFDFANAQLASHNDSLRQQLWERFVEVGLPSTTDEVWRYAPLGDFDLDSFAAAEASVNAAPLADALAAHAGVTAHVVDGVLTHLDGGADGLHIQQVAAETSIVLEHYDGDAFALLNGALTPNPITIEVTAGAIISGPLLIVNTTTRSTSFPQLIIRAGDNSSLSIVEYVAGGENALVVPLTELHVGVNASLHFTTYQRLASTAWHIARSGAYLAKDARLRQSVISLGGHYNRSRNDADMVGANAENELRTTFLGTGTQIHDYRTRQFHLAGRTRSTLLSKGAVADTARSVYTGLIEIEKGAKRTDARQTNHNLLLSPHAHADSVPNLDIRENDVMCAHASSVGPLDELQRWYLESRGVPPDVAERLMIQGFFYEMVATLPEGLAAVVEADITEALAATTVVTP
jgi:Fe-S cluster assembly protein SufD